MKHLINVIYWKYSKLIKYGIFGASSSCLDFVVYTMLIMFNMNMLLANVIGVNCGIFTSFILNRKYNFRVKDHTKQRFIIFYTIGLIGLALSSGLLYTLVLCMGMNEIIAKMITILVVALFQFFLNSRITFKTNNCNIYE